MMEEPAKGAFYIDGSLRDIYIFGTDEQDWQKFLTFLCTSSYPLEFIIAGEQQPIPDRIEDVFSLVHSQGGVLYIDEEHLALHCYFSTSEEIELDLDPRNMHTEQQISRLLDFMHKIGRLLNKTVVLTPENASWVALFRFDPRTGEEEWRSQ